MNYFKKSDRPSENPAPFIYYSKSRKETVWIYIGRTGFTLFGRFRKFRRAELPDEYSMQCTPPDNFWGTSVSEKVISYVVPV